MGVREERLAALSAGAVSQAADRLGVEAVALAEWLHEDDRLAHALFALSTGITREQLGTTRDDLRDTFCAFLDFLETQMARRTPHRG
jgi:hypothetical protein